MSRNTRFSIILAAAALLAAVAVLAIMVGMDRGSPRDVAYASDPNAGSEDVAAQSAGGLTTRAIDLPGVQDYCRSQTDQHYEDCVAVHKVLDALKGTSTARLDYFTSTTTGRVIKLKLNSQKERLDGHIPAEIGELAMLEELWLHNNRLSGTLPSELGDLGNLNWLFLSNNKLGGQIPEDLNKLELDRFWIHKNDFTGCVPYNLTLTREYKADSDLPACAPPGDGATPTPTPTPGAGDPTPTPTAVPTTTPDVPTSADVVKRIHCQPADFVAVFGETDTYTLDDQEFYYYDRNGRGLWETLTTWWVSSSDSRREVVCRTKVYDNISGAIFDNYYATMVEETAGSYDVLNQHRRRSVEDDLVYRGLLLDLGASAVVTAGEVVWNETATRLVSLSSFRWDQVIVQVAVFDDNYYYMGSADAMTRRVESRFDGDIFDDIATRQQASRSEGRVGGVTLSEDSLYLNPLTDKR